VEEDRGMMAEFGKEKRGLGRFVVIGDEEGVEVVNVGVWGRRR
jgi:hypothetical protein